MRIDRGTVVLLDLDPTRGHEQRGYRPCIVLSDPAVSEHQRFPMLCVVPLTGTAGQGALYPSISPGTRTGLAKTSWALIDHLRSVDKRRVTRRLGELDASEFASVEEGVRLLLGL